jgi:hypothetical protein
MIDPDIKRNVGSIQTHIDEINKIITELYKKGVDIQLTFDNNTNGKTSDIPSLELWRAVHRVDYLQ